LDEFVVRVVTAAAYGLLLALTVPSLRKDLKRTKEQYLELHRRLRERGLTIFDAWKKRYYLPEMTDVSFEEQVRRTVSVSILLTASLGLLAVGLGFAFDVPPDRAMWAPPMGGLMMFTLGIALTLCFSLIRRMGKRFWKPLEPIEEGIPATSELEPFPIKPWLILGLAGTVVAFFSAALTSYLLQREVNWSSSGAIAFGTFTGLILMMWLMKRKG